MPPRRAHLQVLGSNTFFKTAQRSPSARDGARDRIFHRLLAAMTVVICSCRRSRTYNAENCCCAYTAGKFSCLFETSGTQQRMESAAWRASADYLSSQASGLTGTALLVMFSLFTEQVLSDRHAAESCAFAVISKVENVFNSHFGRCRRVHFPWLRWQERSSRAAERRIPLACTVTARSATTELAEGGGIRFRYRFWQTRRRYGLPLYGIRPHIFARDARRLPTWSGVKARRRISRIQHRSAARRYRLWYISHLCTLLHRIVIHHARNHGI